MAERITSREHLFRTENIGFHGTSLEATLFMLQHGYLPGCTVRPGDPLFPFSPGDVYFYGKRGTCPIPLTTLRDPQSALGGAVAYAKTIAGRHYIVDKLGLDITNPDHLHLANELSDGDYSTRLYDHTQLMDLFRQKGLSGLVETHTAAFAAVQDTFARLQQMGFTMAQLAQIAREAQQRQGVVMAIKPVVVDHFSVQPSPDAADEGALVIETQTGLPLNFVSGIYPVGSIEQTSLATALL